MPRPRTDLRPRKQKVCIFCKDKDLQIDYKETGLLRKFVSDRGKIRPRRVSGNCRQHQRDIAVAIRNAREMALLPFTTLPTASRDQRRERPSATTTGSQATPVAAQGSVKLFDPDKGFGFIAPDGGGPDVYVHHSAIDGNAARRLEENQRVSFEIIPGKKGPKADHVSPL